MKKLSLAILCACFALLPAFAADIQVTAPAEGASWKIGTSHTVQWTFSGLPATTKVHVLLWQGGTKLGSIAKQHPIGNDGQGSFSWNVGDVLDVPPAVAGSGYFIKVRTVDDTCADVSGTFSLTSGSTITGPQASQLEHNYELVPKKPKPEMPGVNDAQVHAIHVTAPKSGDAVPPYGGCDIRWNCVNVSAENVSITLLRDGQPVIVLASSTPNSGLFSWHMGQQPPDPGNYKIAVETLDKAHRGLSGQFTLEENGTITILAPANAATIANGSSVEIKWKRGGNIQKVDISLNRISDGSNTLLVADVDAKLESKIVVLSPGEGGQYRISIRNSLDHDHLALSGILLITVD